MHLAQKGKINMVLSFKSVCRQKLLNSVFKSVRRHGHGPFQCLFTLFKPYDRQTLLVACWFGHYKAFVDWRTLCSKVFVDGPFVVFCFWSTDAFWGIFLCSPMRRRTLFACHLSVKKVLYQNFWIDFSRSVTIDQASSLTLPLLGPVCNTPKHTPNHNSNVVQGLVDAVVVVPSVQDTSSSMENNNTKRRKETHSAFTENTDSINPISSLIPPPSSSSTVETLIDVSSGENTRQQTSSESQLAR